jgi:hypothetical protein
MRVQPFSVVAPAPSGPDGVLDVPQESGYRPLRLWAGRVPVLAVLAVLPLYGVWATLLATGGGDLAAQYAWAGFFARNPDSAYGLFWYGGTHTANYSVLSPPLMAMLGVRTASVLAGVAATWLLGSLLERTVTRAPLWPALLGALGLWANVASGRTTFAIGLAFGTRRPAGRGGPSGRGAGPADRGRPGSAAGHPGQSGGRALPARGRCRVSARPAVRQVPRPLRAARRRRRDDGTAVSLPGRAAHARGPHADAPAAVRRRGVGGSPRVAGGAGRGGRVRRRGRTDLSRPLADRHQRGAARGALRTRGAAVLRGATGCDALPAPGTFTAPPAARRRTLGHHPLDPALSLSCSRSPCRSPGPP